MFRSTMPANQPDARRKRRRTSSFFASVKFVGRENGFFWAVWSHASFAKGACLDAGFSADVRSALQAVADAPEVGRSRVVLMDPCLAHATFAFVWRGSSVADPGKRAPEDDAYEVARSRQWSPPEPPHRVERSNGHARPAGHRGQGSSRTATTPYWCSVLGTSYPCSLNEIRRAFRVGVLTAHPDHGGTSEAFVRLKTAYDHALKEVGA